MYLCFVDADLPSNVGDNITVRACAGYSSNCSMFHNIEIKNCGPDNFVFFLYPTRSPSEAYCIGTC